jgi:NADPH-dependent F420 reductase
MADVKIGIIGVGNVGGNLGIRLAKSGHAVRFGVKPGKDVTELLQRCEGKAQAAAVPEVAAWADVLFIAVPASAAVAAVRDAGNLAGKVVVDCNNPVAWGADGPTLAPVPEGSLTAAIARAAPGARVVKGFNTFGAEFHLDPHIASTRVDVQLAGDDAEAKKTVAAIAERAGFNPMDCGPLRNAALLENLALLWIHLAVKGGQGRHVAFKLLQRTP